jgi:hypothetical protein
MNFYRRNAFVATTSRFQVKQGSPLMMPDQYAAAVHDYLRAKVEQRAPEVTIESKGKPAPQVINNGCAQEEHETG